MDISFSDLIIYFYIYSVLGYITEVIYCSCINRKLTNRGFFYGPYCPIYGFGAIFSIIFLSDFVSEPILLFVVAFLCMSVLEYITTYIFEMLFNIKLWDYSDMKFNIQGRVCLLNSALFGLLTLFLAYSLHPFVSSYVNKSSGVFKDICVWTIVLTLIYDLIKSIESIHNFEDKLTEISTNLSDIKVHLQEKYEIELENIITNLSELKKTALLNNDSALHTLIQNFEKRISNATANPSRIFSKFKNLKYKKSPETIEAFKSYLKSKIEKINDKIL